MDDLPYRVTYKTTNSYASDDDGTDNNKNINNINITYTSIILESAKPDSNDTSVYSFLQPCNYYTRCPQ